jgi:hypothetical protein
MITAISAAVTAALSLQAAEPMNASWLEGCWEGEGLGAPVTECWMSAPSGRMTGVFQMLNADGAQRFSEIFILDHFDDGPALRLKHFDPGLAGWEAQEAYISWPLIEAGEHRLVFEGLEMSLDDAGRLVVDLDISRNGEISTERFTYTRMDQGAR